MNVIAVCAEHAIRDLLVRSFAASPRAKELNRIARRLSPPTASLQRHVELVACISSLLFLDDSSTLLRILRCGCRLHRSIPFLRPLADPFAADPVYIDVDIYGVGGKGIGKWAQEWNAAMQTAAAAKDPQERTRIIEEEKRRNTGYKLYMALQTRGGWAQPPGYPVQLFGPWTRSEGPHKQISDRMLRAHRDHIHVAK